MRDEVKRISRLVAEGKLSPEDAADLIDAFYASERTEPVEEPVGVGAEGSANGSTPPPPPPGSHRDPLKNLLDNLERLTKEGLDSANWQEVSKQVREGAKKGFETLKSGIEDIGKGKVHLGWLTSQEVKEVSLPLSIPAGKALRIENTTGDVKVVGGFDSGTATATARFKANSLEEARQKAEGYTLIIEESEHNVLIKQPEIAGLSVDLDIQYPGTGPVEIRSESGDVQVMDTGAGLEVGSRSGDVRIRGLNGLVKLLLESGDVSVEDVDTTSLAIENQSGDIQLARVRGNTNVRTASGDVTINQVSGKVLSIESVSGNVSIDLAEPVLGSVNIRTMSGDTSLSVPDGSDCRVSLATLRGDVSCGIPLQNEAKTEQRITGQLGAGTGSLDISAVTGDVSLALHDAATT